MCLRAHQSPLHPGGDTEVDKVDDSTLNSQPGTSTDCFCPSLRCELLRLVLSRNLSIVDLRSIRPQGLEVHIFQPLSPAHSLTVTQSPTTSIYSHTWLFIHRVRREMREKWQRPDQHRCQNSMSVHTQAAKGTGVLSQYHGQTQGTEVQSPVEHDGTENRKHGAMTGSLELKWHCHSKLDINLET